MSLLTLDKFKEILETKGIDIYKCNGRTCYKGVECTEYELLGKDKTTVYVNIRL